MTPSPLAGALERIHAHDHLCSIYDGPAERMAAALPFIRIGLERGEKCVYVGDGEGSDEVLLKALKADGADVERFTETGALVLRVKEQAYQGRGGFEPHAMLDFWREQGAQAASAGFAAIRGAGEARGLLRNPRDTERWLEYEGKLTEMMLEFNCRVLCQYDCRRHPPETILGVLHTHPLVIVDGAVCANSYYVPRQELLHGNRAEREVARLLGNLRERERAEEKVRETNARFLLFLNSISDHVFAFSKDWRFIYLNKHAAAQLVRLGKDPERIIGKVLWDEFPQVPNEATIRRAMLERVPVVEELYYAPLREWVENRWYPTDDGGLVTYQRYVTEQKRSEAALRRSEAQLIEGQRISHNGSWSWNAESGELFWSAEHFRIWGLDPAQAHPTAAEAVGMVHPDDQQRMWRVWEEAIGARTKYECEFRVVRSDGTIRHVHSLGQPRLDSSGALVEYVGTVMDVTERKRAAQDLHKAREELSRVNRILTVGELTASIAHELNQPLAAVMINANACERWLAARPPNLAEANDALRHISRDANRASEVISRIRALLMRSSTSRVYLRIDEVLRDVASLVQGQVATHHVTMLTEVEPELPALLADRVQLQQLILNLVLNALESMSAVSGKRVLNLRAGRQGPEEVFVSVRDTGIGVNPLHIEQVFDPFFTTKADGMGMGLAISRSIVEAHQGRLWATQNDGPGATFRFTLPALPRP